MPIFKFHCFSCEKDYKKLLKKREAFYCECGDYISPSIPTSTSAVTKDLKDPYRGVSHTKNLDRQLKKRMNDHHDRHEVEEKIDQHGKDDAQRLGWDKKVKRV